MTQIKRLVVYGAGGFGTEVIWGAQLMNEAGTGSWELVGLIDDSAELKGTSQAGVPVLGSLDEVREQLGGDLWFHVAVGENKARRELATKLEGAGWRAATIIYPNALIGPEATIADGAYVGPGCVVGPAARVGRYVLLNTHASVGHHAKLSDFARLDPGARVNDHCEIGELAVIGSSAAMVPKSKVGEGATLGGGSMLVGRVSAGNTALGVPAHTIRRTQKAKTP